MPFEDRPPADRLPPHPELVEYYASDAERQAWVTELFDRSAPHYDWINGVIGLGSGRWYRGDALRRAGLRPGMRVLDVACGTGASSLAAAGIVGPSGSVIGVDPSTGMLREARRRGLAVACGRAEALPFASASFDLVSMGYALRHVFDLRVAFAEYRRVLKPGGRLLLLEIARPRGAVPFRLTRFYMRSVVPWLARLRVDDEGARRLTRYYWDTIARCVPAETILAALDDTGFVECAVTELVYGLIKDYAATNP